MVVAGLDRARHRDLAGAHDFLDTERADQSDEGLDLFAVAGNFDRHRALADIDHVGAERIDDAVEFRTRPFVDRYPHQHEFAIESIDLIEIRDLDDADELVELLRYLLEDLSVAGGHQYDS